MMRTTAKPVVARQDSPTGKLQQADSKITRTISSKPPTQDSPTDKLQPDDTKSNNKFHSLADTVGFTDRYPDNEEEIQKVEAILDEQMKKLSIVEREEILFDIHGLPRTRDEDPPTVDTYLSDLDDALFKIHDKQAYNVAKYMNEAYVKDRSFRLMFLRCESFDVEAAAKLMVHHFEVKKELFGAGEILARDILLSDLSEEAMVLLEVGFVQLLPFRDAAGRSVVCLNKNPKPPHSSDALSQCIWYFYATLVKDEETQKKGFVAAMFFLVGDGALPDPADLPKLKQMIYVQEAIPQRPAGVHFCYDAEEMRPAVAGIELNLNSDRIRNRFLTHFGTLEEVKFQMQTYGIPTQNIQVDKNSIVSVEQHLQWIEMRKRYESKNCIGDDIIVPRRFDVLFGRGKIAKEHTGNLRAVHLVEMHQEQYDKANRYQKTEIAERIISIIHESHGRFLKWEGDDGWVEVDYNVARDKVSHFFRRCRLRHKKASEEANNSDSSTADNDKMTSEQDGDESKSLAGSSDHSQKQKRGVMDDESEVPNMPDLTPKKSKPSEKKESPAAQKEVFSED